MDSKYRRVLLKLSGEALAGSKNYGLDAETIYSICKQIKACLNLGVQMGIVVGGGNFWRGRNSGEMDRTLADHIGMLATVMNALSVADTLEQLGAAVRIQTAIDMPRFAEPYICSKAIKHMKKGRVVVFGCGTGNPFFSTDTAAALRAAEVNADIILKATNVDGVYDKDPKLSSEAIKYDKVSFHEILNKDLGVMDSTAASLCKDNNIPVLVFSIESPQNILKAICGENIGTLVES